jgi:hypothetical protein
VQRGHDVLARHTMSDPVIARGRNLLFGRYLFDVCLVATNLCRGLRHPGASPKFAGLRRA